MADKMITTYNSHSSPTTDDKFFMVGASEEYLIDYAALAGAILDRLTSKTYSDLSGDTVIDAILGNASDISTTNGRFKSYTGSSDNVENIYATGIYFIGNNVGGKPLGTTGGGTGGVLFVGGYGTQNQNIVKLYIYTAQQAGAAEERKGIFMRTFSGTVDSGWIRIVDSGDYVELITGHYISNNVNINAEVNLTPVGYPSFAYAIVNCVEGDQFTVTGCAGNNGRLWSFLSSSNTLISKANNVSYEENTVLTAPTGSAKVIFNVNMDFPYIVYKGNHMAVDRNFKKQAIPQARINDVPVESVAMPTLAYHHTIQETSGVSGAKTGIFNTGEYFCITYGENLDGTAGDYPKVSSTGELAMKYKFFRFANEAESNVSYGTFAQKGSTYTDYTGATATFVGGCGLPSGRNGKQFFTSAYTGTNRYNGFNNYGMTPCVCDVTVSSSGVTFGAINELVLVVNGVSGKFDLTRIDPENVNYNLYLTTAPPSYANGTWHWIQPGKHSLIYMTSTDAITWTYKWAIPTDFDPCCEVPTVVYNGHILAAVRTWGSNNIKYTSSTLYMMLLNTGGYIMHQYRIANVSTRSYLVNSGDDVLLFFNPYKKTTAECIRITSENTTFADGLSFHKWFTVYQKGSWYITCNESSVSSLNFSDMYLAGGNDPGPSQANGMEFIHLTFNANVAHSPEDVPLTALNDAIPTVVSDMRESVTDLTGSQSAGISSGNFNTLVSPGSYQITDLSSVTNGPLSSGSGILIVVKARTYMLQRFEYGTTEYIRVSTNGGSSWGAWVNETTAAVNTITASTSSFSSINSTYVNSYVMSAYKVGRMVFLWCQIASTSTAAPAETDLAVLPTAYRPVGEWAVIGEITSGVSANQARNLLLRTDGSIRIHNYNLPAGTWLRFSVSYISAS